MRAREIFCLLCLFCASLVRADSVIIGEDGSQSEEDPRMRFEANYLVAVGEVGGNTIYQCKVDGQEDTPAHENPLFGMMVLDNAFKHGDEKFKRKGFNGEDALSSDDLTAKLATHKFNLLTPQLRTTMPEWRRKGLLDFMHERILFLQEITAKHCQLVNNLSRETHKFKIYGSFVNLGIPGAFDFMVNAATAKYVMFLERDFHLDMHNREAVEQTLNYAGGLLSRGEATIVLLRNIDVGRGFGGMSSVCTQTEFLNAAFTPDEDPETHKFDMYRCLRESPLRRFHTAIAAFDLCTDKAIATANELKTATICRDTSKNEEDKSAPNLAFCYSSRIAHWTNNPSFAPREFLREKLLPLFPDCFAANADSFCKYAGIEISMELQCALRELDYPVVQTAGIFRHLNPFRHHDISRCEIGDGYWKPEENVCEEWQ